SSSTSPMATLAPAAAKARAVARPIPRAPPVIATVNAIVSPNIAAILLRYASPENPTVRDLGIRLSLFSYEIPRWRKGSGRTVGTDRDASGLAGISRGASGVVASPALVVDVDVIDDDVDGGDIEAKQRFDGADRLLANLVGDRRDDEAVLEDDRDGQ